MAIPPVKAATRPYLRKPQELFGDSAAGVGPLGGCGVCSARTDAEMMESLGVSLAAVEKSRRLVLELEITEFNRAQCRDNADIDQIYLLVCKGSARVLHYRLWGFSKVRTRELQSRF